MKQKIVVKVQMSCQKCRTKALKIAASSDGVEKVSLEGNEKDQVVVIGDGFDPIRLIKCLKKKVGNAQILNLDEVKPGSEDQKEEEKSSSTFSISSSSTLCRIRYGLRTNSKFLLSHVK